MPENPGATRDAEWKILKQIQQQERREFFTSGKAAFSELRTSVYREVRAEFRDRWAEFYEARYSDADPAALAEMKAALLTDQNRLLAERRDEACIALRESRDDSYRELLDSQRERRLDLRWRQENGLESGIFLDGLREHTEQRASAAAFQNTATELTQPPKEKAPPVPGPFDVTPHQDRGGMRSSGAIALDVGFGLFSFLAGFAGGGSGEEIPPPHPREPEWDPRPGWDQAAKQQDEARQQRAQEEDDDERRKRQSADARE